MQVQYSLLSCGPLQQSIKAACDDLGVTLIAYSPLALGLLTGAYSLEGAKSGGESKHALFCFLFILLKWVCKCPPAAAGARAYSRRVPRAGVAQRRAQH